MENKQKTALVLGGTHAQVALVKHLKRRGYHTILIDYLPSPPCKDVADEHIQCSTLDKEAVLSVAKQRGAALVISTSVDQANVTACYVSEQLNLPAPYRHDTALHVANKVTMKQTLRQHGIRTPTFEVFNTMEAVRTLSLAQTMVVKPADCGGSKAVRTVIKDNELVVAAEKAFEASKNKHIILEEYCDGDEYSADFVVVEGRAKLLLIRRKYIHNGQHNSVVCSYATITPCVETESSLTRRIEEIAQQICQVFELNNTALIIQFIWRDDDLYVLEFAPRIGGSLAADTIVHQTGFDIVHAAVDAWLGLPVDVRIAPPKGFFCTHHVYAHSCTVHAIEQVDALLNAHIIDGFFIHKNKGDRITGTFASSDRACSFIVRGSRPEDILSSINTVFEHLKIIDENGHNMLNSAIKLTTF